MTYTKLALLTLLWLHQCLGYRIHHIARRNALNILVGSTCTIIHVQAIAQENKQLTPEELLEYNKLLDQAKRIQDIIDVNKKALEEQNKDILKNIFFDRIFSELFDEGITD